MGPDVMNLVFWMLSFKPAFSLCSFTLIKRLFSSLLSAIRVISSAYLRLLIFLPAILTPVCASFSLPFRMMNSAYKLNKHGDNIQTWYTSFPIWNQSVVPCLVLTVASWPTYSFLMSQVRWSGVLISLKNFPQFVVVHTVKVFSIDNESEVDVFPGLPWFHHDPTNVGNLISGLSASLKSSLYLWKFSVHVLLKPSLKKFEYYLVSMWNEHNCMIVWTFYGLASLCDWNKNFFQSCGHYWVFQISWHIECSTFTASPFRIWNGSAGNPLPPLALFIVMLPKAYLTSYSRMSGSM